jgi:hypothetical protein
MEQLARLPQLALRTPEACEAHGGAEFPRFGLLLARNSEGALEMAFCFALIPLCASKRLRGGTLAGSKPLSSTWP